MATGRSADMELGKPLKKKHVMHRLEDMFGSIFDWNIIHSVAQHCNWNLHLSAEKLVVMSGDLSSSGSKQLSHKQFGPPGKGLEQYSSPQKKFARVPKKYKDKNSASTGKQKKCLPTQGASRQVYPPILLSHCETSGLGVIKVAYQGMHCSEDLDDADVVVEEETEFEIVGGHVLRRNGVELSSLQRLAPGNFASTQTATSKNEILLKYTPEELNKLRSHTQKKQTPRPARHTHKQKSVQSETQKNNTVNLKNPIIRIRMHIQSGTRILILLRGVPGSGKSYMARNLVKGTVVGHYRDYVFSADDYFTRRNGQYVYDPARLSEAHEWVRKRVEDKMKKSESPVFVDNTHLQSWEMQPYAVLAVSYGYVLELLEPHNPWRYVENKLVEKNIHGVPRYKIREMLQRFEPQHTGKSLLKLLNLSYHPAKKPPQPVAQKSLAARIDKTQNILQKKEEKKKNGSHICQMNTFNDGSKSELQKRNELKDILTLYFAKKVQDQGKQLDLKACNTKLSSGLTVTDILTSARSTKDKLKADSHTQLTSNNLMTPETKASTPLGVDDAAGCLHEAGNTFGLLGLSSNSSSDIELAEGSSDSGSDASNVEQGGSDWEDIEVSQVTLTASVGNKESNGLFHDDLWKYVLVNQAADSPGGSDEVTDHFSVVALGDPPPCDQMVDSTDSTVQEITTCNDVLRLHTLVSSASSSCTHRELFKTNTASIGIPEISTIHSNMPDISAIHSGIPEINANHSSIPDINSTHSGMQDVSTAHADILDIVATHSDMGDMHDTHTSILDTSVTYSDVFDISANQNGMVDTSAAYVDMLDISANNSNVLEINTIPISISEMSAAHSGVPVISTIHSNVTEISVSHSDMPDINSIHSDLPDNATHSSVLEISASCSDIPDINSIHSNLPDNATHSSILEISASYSDMPDINAAQVNILEMSSHSDMPDVGATHSDISVINSTHSGIIEICATHSDIPEISAMHIGMSENNIADKDKHDINSNSRIVREVSAPCENLPVDLQSVDATKFAHSSSFTCSLIDNVHKNVSDVVVLRDSKDSDVTVASALLLGAAISGRVQENSTASGLLNVVTVSPENCVTMGIVENYTNELNTDRKLDRTLGKNAVDQSDCFENSIEGNSSSDVTSGDICSSRITNEEMEQWIGQLKQDLVTISNYNVRTVLQNPVSTEHKECKDNNIIGPYKDLVDVSLQCLGDGERTKGKTGDYGKVNEIAVLKHFDLNSAKELDKCTLSTYNCELISEAVEFITVHSDEEGVVSDQALVTIGGDTSDICVSEETGIVSDEVDSKMLHGAILPMVDVPVKTSGRDTCPLEQQPHMDSGSCVIEDCNEGKEPSLLGAAKPEHEEIWHNWEYGIPWEGSEAKPVMMVSSTDAELPKPARHMRRERMFTGAVMKKSTVCNDPPVLDDIGDWQPVVDADVSWQSENSVNFVSLETLLSSEVPRPQRKIFAGDESSDKSMPELCDKLNLLDKSDAPGTESLLQLQEGEQNYANNGCQRKLDEKILTEASTNTHHTDFWVAGLVESNDRSEEMLELFDVKVLANSGLYISGSLFPESDCTRNVPSVLKLDKSSMTGEDNDCLFSVVYADGMASRQNFEQLSRVFSHIPRDQLKELFERCKKDVNWTAEMLLDSGYEPQDTLQDFNDSIGDDADDGHENQGSSAPEAATTEQFFHGFGTKPPIVSTSKSVETRSCMSKKGCRNTFKIQPSAKSLELKKHFETNICFNSSHYSEHVLRLKRIRHGELVEIEEANSSPSQEQSVPPADEVDESESVQHKEVSVDVVTMLNGTNFSVSSDNTEVGNVTVWQPMEEALETREQLIDEEQMWLPLTLEHQFVDMLHSLFGNPAMPFPSDLAPVVKVPVSLARQLYCYLMDTQLNHMEQQSRGDEELARQLQRQEHEAGRVANLQEIMDMEMALALYRADIDKSCAETRNDMATRLTRIKLAEVFPEVEEGVLVEVLRAHNYSFSETCEVLQASVAGGQEDRVRNVFSPEALAQYEQKLLQQAQLESAKSVQLEEAPKTVEDSSSAKDMALQDAKYFRSEAARHAKLRVECDRKAYEAYRSKLYNVASYYSQVGELHKRHMDDANARAASSLLTYHSLSHFTTTLDLHFLQVPEALQVLDMFLDAHVSNLLDSEQQMRTLYIITGHGVHSVGGRARLRPAVAQRLKDKGLRFQQTDNPGLLTVCVKRHTPLSSNT